MTRIDFLLGGQNELIEQIVGFHPKTFTPAYLDVAARLVFLAQVVAEFRRAAWSQRDHLVGEVRVMLSGLTMAESAQGFDDRVLRLRLTGVDNVVNFGDVAEVRMIFFSVHRGNPAV